ncbi:gustatory receptor-like 43a [Drosophila montana]|uniref:gustatory receptor-like 43a n=1 Tax=Drosophila montana TaxID=40370 RepID=UPI00313B1DA2
MWNSQDIRLLRGGLAQAVYRRFFQCSAWLLYGIARGCHFFKLRYNKQHKRMEEMQYHRIISKLVVTVKCLVFLRDAVDYMVLGFVVWIHLFKVEDSGGQNFLIGIVMQGLTMYVLRRVTIFLHSQEDRKLIMHVVNEIFFITRTIESKFGMIYHCELCLLCVYFFKQYLLYVMLDSMWHKPYFLWINFFYWVLMEYCSLGYFIYQLILLNWYRNFSFFLQRFIEYHGSQSFISGRYHRRLLCLFKIHLRINNLHQHIKKKVAWLPSAIYLAIFTSIFNMTLMIECIVYAADEIENKVYIMSDGCLGPAVIPMLNVFIIGLCTDRLRSEELTLQQQIVLINILYVRKAFPHDHTLKVLNNEHTSLIVHQKLEPLLNVIILDTTCDREFAFDYFLTVIVTALSFVQYTVSTGRILDECVTHK